MAMSRTIAIALFAVFALAAAGAAAQQCTSTGWTTLARTGNTYGSRVWGQLKGCRCARRHANRFFKSATFARAARARDLAPFKAPKIKLASLLLLSAARLPRASSR